MPAKARELLSMADECRDLASYATSATVQEQLLEIAEQFERIAKQRLEKLGRVLLTLH